MKLSAWRRNSSAIIGGWLRIVETTDTRTPCRWRLSTSGLKSPSPENSTTCVKPRRQLHGIDGQFDVHVALDLPAPLAVGVFLRGLRHERKAVVVQPVDERPDRRILLVFEECRIVEGPQELAPAHELLPQQLVVDVEAKRLRRGIKVRAIDEQRKPFVAIEHIRPFQSEAPPVSVRECECGGLSGSISACINL
jgi:hypothetical protein